MSSKAKCIGPVQRVRVDLESEEVKIRSEHYNENLGWYTSGSLSLPLHQLPLLEQALDRAKGRRPRERSSAVILPFPRTE